MSRVVLSAVFFFRECGDMALQADIGYLAIRKGREQRDKP